MRIAVVADVHGNYAALSRAADAADRLIILGDLLDYVDYHDPSQGILGEMFDADSVLRFAALRAAGEFAALRRLNAELWGSIADASAVLSGLVQDRYRAVVAAVPEDTVVMLGNVDVAAEWDAVAGDALPRRDAEVLTIDGVRFAFVAGGVRRVAHPTRDSIVTTDPSMFRHPWRPLVRPEEEYVRAVQALGPADVLCSHIPPDLALLRYDTVPARVEMAGPGLLEYIDRMRPALALSGHVHQPLAARTRRGLTECRNVGHFQRAEEPVIFDTTALQPVLRPSVVNR